MPRFSLRTLLILTAMLAVLLAQRPYVIKHVAIMNSQPPWQLGEYYTLNPMFFLVGAVEFLILIAWYMVNLASRRRSKKIANSN